MASNDTRACLLHVQARNAAILPAPGRLHCIPLRFTRLPTTLVCWAWVTSKRKLITFDAMRQAAYPPPSLEALESSP